MSEQAEQAPCTARHINHVCIAVSDIEDTLNFYRDLFGVGDAEIEDSSEHSIQLGYALQHEPVTGRVS